MSDCTEALKRDPKCIVNDHMHHVTLLQVLSLVRGLPHARTVNTAGIRVRLDGISSSSRPSFQPRGDRLAHDFLTRRSSCAFC